MQNQTSHPMIIGSNDPALVSFKQHLEFEFYK
jgi:hypothetical protein